MIDSKMGVCVLFLKEWDRMGWKKHIWVLSVFSLSHVAVLYVGFVAGKESSLGMWRGREGTAAHIQCLEKQSLEKLT